MTGRTPGACRTEIRRGIADVTANRPGRQWREEATVRVAADSGRGGPTAAVVVAVYRPLADDSPDGVV